MRRAKSRSKVKVKFNLPTLLIRHAPRPALTIFSIAVLAQLVVACREQSVVSSPLAQTAPVPGMQIDLPLDLPVTATTPKQQTIVLAGGCFWGMEAVFEKLKGVKNVVSGFAGGSAATANYAAVSSGSTSHAEVVKITYDPRQISLGKLLKIYFLVAHDPTQIDRQGPDTGKQYRSAIFFSNPDQQKVAQAYIDRLNQSKVFQQPIATQLAALGNFYAAEDYHQNFIDRNPTYPYVVIHDLPKLAQLRQQFPDLIQ
jgi:peptide-methionine (S)-S-oxide reductase